MDTVYVLDPAKWVGYIRPTICPLCGLPSDEGTHRQFYSLKDQDLPVWGCHVPMAIVNPASSVRITDIAL